jgi:hypothetical protein
VFLNSMDVMAIADWQCIIAVVLLVRACAITASECSGVCRHYLHAFLQCMNVFLS